MILDLPVCAFPPPRPNIIIVLHVLVIPNTGPLARNAYDRKSPLRVGYYGAAGSTDKDGNGGGAAGGSGYVGGHAGHVVSNGVTEASSTVFNTAVTQPPKTDNEHYVIGVGVASGVTTAVDQKKSGHGMCVFSA